MLTLFMSAPLAGQDARPVTAENVIAAAEKAYRPPDAAARPACPEPRPGDEIVVCAEADKGDYRVDTDSDLDEGGLRGAARRAPDMATFYPGGVAARGCFVPPCPPPMPELIDLQAIPEAPAGSDADLIARGERRQ